MKRRMLAAIMAAVMLLGGSLALAADHTGHGGSPGHPGHHGVSDPAHHERHGHEAGGPAKDLNLTSEQKTKLKELRWKFDGETAQLRGTLLTKRLELRTLWRNPKSDPKAILDKEKELWGVQYQLREKAVLHRIEVRKVLTPEQIEAMKPGWERGRGFDRHHIMDEMDEGPGAHPGMGQGMGHGMGRGGSHGGSQSTMGQGMGHGMGRGRGMGSGMGM